MKKQPSLSPKSRIAFLLLLALVISLLFYWVIKGLLLAVFLAAVLAGLLHPLYRRILTWMKGRKGLAAGATVVLSLVVVIIPAIVFLGLVIGEAGQMTEAAKEWLAARDGSSAGLQEQLKQDPDLKRLLPYQDQILEKDIHVCDKILYVARGYVVEKDGAYLDHGPQMKYKRYNIACL